MRRTRAHDDVARGDDDSPCTARVRRSQAQATRKMAHPPRRTRLEFDVWWFLIRSREVAAKTQLAIVEWRSQRSRNSREATGERMDLRCRQPLRVRVGFQVFSVDTGS